ncbi:MAG TPA: septum site-determining protein MinD [Firmicutes bacterium]|nr:septum site-determining protein MinD [Bacillota bacterium]
MSARKIVVTSGKGGVGKTTVCCNLGVQLARQGRRVIVCDLDFGLNNADVVLGVENRALYDVLDAIEGRCRPKQALVTHPRYPALSVLSSGRTLERYVSPQAIRLILDTLAPQFDYILIDSPAGIEEGFHRAASCAEEALLVTTPHISALRDADRVAGILKSYRFSRVGLVVNRVRKDFFRRGEILAPAEIADLLRIPLAAVIAEEDKVQLDNVVSRSRTFRALAEACEQAPEREAKARGAGGRR